MSASLLLTQKYASYVIIEYILSTFQLILAKQYLKFRQVWYNLNLFLISYLLDNTAAITVLLKHQSCI